MKSSNNVKSFKEFNENLNISDVRHRFNDSDIKNYNGKMYKKQSDDKWLEISEYGMTKDEHLEELHYYGFGKVTPENTKEYNKHYTAYHKLSDKKFNLEDIS